MSVAVYPGSFDPITCGHLDIIKRCLLLYDKVIVGVLCNSAKKPMFEADERVELIKKALGDAKNCEIKAFDGLLVDFVRQEKADVIVRGLRAITDFEYEFQMALLNKKLCPEVETLFMVTSTDYSYVSSSIVKELASLGGDFSRLVPDEILEDIKLKITEGR
ncbi:MAG: pantetheine-phosphate adenylyltransferase [Clostridia bacterium]|nr:pantetheine-phosphate adenylyltransferase [Clostridia bacterium]